MRHRSKVTILLALASSISCKHPTLADSSAAMNAASPENEAPPTERRLARSLLAMVNSEAPRLVALTGEASDSLAPGLLMPQLDAATSSLLFDFTALAPVLDGEMTPTQLRETLRFHIPTLPTTGTPNLNDPEVTKAVFTEITAELIGTLIDIPPSEAANAMVVSIERTREACARTTAATLRRTATFGEQNEETYRYRIDCRQYRRQPISGQTISTLEWAALRLYSGVGYSAMNSLLRAAAKDDEVALTDNSVPASVAILLAASAINKLDPVQRHTFRGANRAFSACLTNAPAAPKPPNPDTNEDFERVVDFARQTCRYFRDNPTLRDCGFSSSTSDPAVALVFSGLGEVVSVEGETAYAAFSENELSKIGVVYETVGNRGIDLLGIAAKPYEREILWLPGLRQNVVSGGATLALSPQEIAAGEYIEYGAHVLRDCDAPLTDSEKRRITHVRVRSAPQ